MRSLCKFFMLLALVLFVPATFVGCGPTQVSDEEAAKTAAPDEDDPGDADAPDAVGGGDDGSGDDGE